MEMKTCFKNRTQFDKSMSKKTAILKSKSSPNQTLAMSSCSRRSASKASIHGQSMVAAEGVETTSSPWLLGDMVNLGLILVDGAPLVYI